MGKQGTRGAGEVLSINERELRLAIALGAGMTNQKAADFAGCAERTFQYNKATYEADPTFILIRSLVRAATARRIDYEVELSTRDMKRELERLNAQAIANIKLAMSSEDERLAYTAGKDHIDRQLGRAAQTNINLNHDEVEVRVVQLPSAFLSRSLKTQQEMGLIEGEVAEAEIVE